MELILLFLASILFFLLICFFNKRKSPVKYVFMIILMLLLTGVLDNFFDCFIANTASGKLPSGLLGVLGAFLSTSFIVLAVSKSSPAPILLAMRRPSDYWAVWKPLLFQLILYIVITLSRMVLGNDPMRPLEKVDLKVVFLVVPVLAFVEEAIFRHWMYEIGKQQLILHKREDKTFSLVLAISILFALMHIETPVNLRRLVQAFIVSLFFFYLRGKTPSLSPLVLSHIIHNWFVYFVEAKPLW